ncbi:hypothetical protein H0G86_013329 [Trichoderma simmonsii]|uniref:Uncharacterized protein n=1 Tax=Trichoderma simmonsii TaxID=1491479 RepID=A0A8G0PIC8_9HYPO|nr:hypothetical protein H0G86_013329 [Trichoderma simmonsii]
MRKQYAWDPTSAELGHSLPRCISISGSCGGDLEGEEINTKSGMGGIIMELLCKNESDGRVQHAMLLDKVGLKVHSAAHVLAEAGPFCYFWRRPVWSVGRYFVHTERQQVLHHCSYMP